MKRFLAFWTLVYLWSVETLYHVLVGLCWFHQGPSFSDGCLLLFSSVYIRCQDGLSAPTVFFSLLLTLSKRVLGLTEELFRGYEMPTWHLLRTDLLALAD